MNNADGGVSCPSAFFGETNVATEIPTTLDEVWTACKHMWTDMTTLPRYTQIDNILSRKIRWLKDHGYDSDEIAGGCFFCHHNKKHRASDAEVCSQCPGRLVDPLFTCLDGDYDYWSFPERFRDKIIELDERRTSNGILC